MASQSILICPQYQFRIGKILTPKNLISEHQLQQALQSQKHTRQKLGEILMEYAYDFASSVGTSIYAMKAGKVISLQDKYPDTGGTQANAAKFNYVWIEHEGGYRSVYAHLQQGFRTAFSSKLEIG